MNVVFKSETYWYVERSASLSLYVEQELKIIECNFIFELENEIFHPLCEVSSDFFVAAVSG